MVKYKNLKGRFADHIISSVSWAIQNLEKITDEKLRECLRNRLENNGTIRIKRTYQEDDEKPNSDDCYTNPKLGGQNKSYFGIDSKEITLCIDNLENLQELNSLSDYILHEFAHSCGWEHGENKGVPFPDGYPNEI
ncbi:MAG: hypothetical protein GWN01_12000 [Nitrosopumilaceae archaeon]|nr:hypothetical protein [Nitrosopumilaceae archaeon]NIU01599.1 hypothetical protein [Nitrosopumilaceae archaeon]NIU88018.1 hypothetical protein [Nitrosopumilaceae archaeon]NIV66285.1 hypothetical protein [Nitrosopumilaceae archaeon]NIX62201.1 hypothetical protein [Nitrosopumilaceae archaeon]